MIKKNTILSFVVTFVLANSLNAIENEKIYASVNGKNITSTDIQIALKNQRVDFNTLEKGQQKQLLEQLVQKNLLVSKAMKSDVTSSEIYKTTLKTTIKNLKEELALQVWMQNLSKGIEITNKEISAFYNENKNQFSKPKEFKASHILVKSQKEAQDIIDSLKNSKSLKADFTEAAKNKSTGPSGSNGGELGWFTSDKMVPEFCPATALLKKNTITSTPVKTQFGYHIIYLDDKKDASIVSLGESKEQIKSMLMQVKFKEKLDSIIKEETSKAKITYN